MKKYLTVIAMIISGITSTAQKQTFNVVSYTQPAGWQKTENEGGVQLSVTDKKTNGYAIAIITKATVSNAPANENFNNDWKRLVKGSVKVNNEPTMTEPANENGWNVLSGSANYTDGAVKGVATLLNATGNGQAVSVLLMTNTQKYQNELLNFINSLELSEAPEQQNNMAVNSGSTNSAIIGLWTSYILETNGYQQYTAGYLRKEYLFKNDGTYIFRNKQWLTKAKDILFIYESGTYTVNGNQLTITPKQGKGQFWSKTNSSKEWGKLVKSSDYKPETVTYTFQIIDDATYGNGIVLKPGKPTERDGGKFNAADDPFEFRYSFRKLESAIDNPPGFKTESENKSAIAQNESTTTVKNNASVVGTWSQSTSSNPFGQSLSDGYTTMQYTFNNNGTYEYVAKTFSQNMSYIIFSKETGKYNIDNNQLTIIPTEGSTKSFTKKPGAADQPDKLIKTEKRPLEKTTYTFTSYYFSGIKETNLVLQNDKKTFRDGVHSTNNLFANAWYYKPVSTNNPKIEMP
ncbi:MAG: lipocalin family protein [Bacteroidetes bacterium]|nr:lipocalin family protein [Bacteroidota bacterium]